MDIKACLFDLDGVIVDTAKYHYIAWKELADDLGFEFTEEQNEGLKGVSRMDSLDILLEIGGITLSEAEKQVLAKEKNDRYRGLIEKMTTDEILPGVKEFLLDLRKNDIKIGLGSSSRNARTILDLISLTTLFDTIIDGTNISNAKPHPEVFLSGAETLGLGPQYCVVFEDAEAGIEAAINAKMRTVGVGPSATLNKADLNILTFNELTVDLLRQKLEGLNG